MKYWIGFDLGGTKMLAVVFDRDLKIVARVRKKTKGFEGKEAGLSRICDTINDAVKKAEIDRKQIAGIGVGCPGPLDLKSGVIHEAPNLGWSNVPIKKRLQSEFGCQAVIANDVDAGVFGEYKFGAAKDARCVVGVFPGTGIGGGCVYNGQILHGANCTCMEIGHIPLIPNGPLDGCGNAGTLESVASRLAISGAAAQAAYRGQAPHLMKTVGTDIREIRSGALSDSVGKGDKAVTKIMENAADYLGLSIVTVVHLLAPDIIVLGGGLVEALPKLFVDRVSRFAKNRVLPSYRDVFKIVAAELGDDATAMGAAGWAQTSIQ